MTAGILLLSGVTDLADGYICLEKGGYRELFQTRICPHLFQFAMTEETKRDMLLVERFGIKPRGSSDFNTD